MKRLALLFAVTCFACGYAHATTVQLYNELKAKGGDDWAIMATYVKGFGAGFQYANVQLVVNHAKPIYCPPQTLELNMDNYLALLDDELAKGKTSKDTYIEVVLTYAIINAFPCKAQK